MITADIKKNIDSPICTLSIKIENEIITEKSQLDELTTNLLLTVTPQVNTVLKYKQIGSQSLSIEQALNHLPNTVKTDLPDIDMRVIFNKCIISLNPNEFKLSDIRKNLQSIECKRFNSQSCFFFDSEVNLFSIDDVLKLYFVRSKVYQTFLLTTRADITVRQSHLDLLGYLTLSEKSEMQYINFPMLIYSGNRNNMVNNLKFRKDLLMLQDNVPIYSYKLNPSFLFSDPDITVTLNDNSYFEYTNIPFELNKSISVPPNSSIQFTSNLKSKIYRNSASSRNKDFCYIYSYLSEGYTHIPLSHLWSKSFNFISEVFDESKIKQELITFDKECQDGVKITT